MIISVSKTTLSVDVPQSNHQPYLCFPNKVSLAGGNGKSDVSPVSESNDENMLDNFTIGRRSDEGREKSTII